MRFLTTDTQFTKISATKYMAICNGYQSSVTTCLLDHKSSYFYSHVSLQILFNLH